MTYLRPFALAACAAMSLGCGPIVAEQPMEGSTLTGPGEEPGSSSTIAPPSEPATATSAPASTTSPSTSASTSTGVDDDTSSGSATGDGSSTTSEGGRPVCGSPLLDPADRLELEGTPMRGNPDGLVTIVQWTGYNDPFSRNAFVTMNALLDGPLGEEVRLVPKQLPLRFQDPGGYIARAALAAEQLGSFWKLHDQMFAYEGELDAVAVDRLAAAIGLDLPTFHAAIESPAVAERLEADRNLFEAVGGSGTPSFVINGEFVQGAQPLDVFEERSGAQLEAMVSLIDDGLSPCEAFAQRLDEQLG